MTPKFLPLCLLLALLASPACAQKVPVIEKTLSNGMRLLLLPRHDEPTVAGGWVAHVGSANERPGITGIAHLFEHMMFKGSKNIEPEAHTSIIASVGGQSNAYTTDDETVFWETAPAQYLPLMLWLESDRMATLRVDDARQLALKHQFQPHPHQFPDHTHALLEFWRLVILGRQHPPQRQPALAAPATLLDMTANAGHAVAFDVA